MKRKAPSTKKGETISVYGCTLELVASYCIVRVHEHTTVDLYAVCGPHCSSNGNCPYKDR